MQKIVDDFHQTKYNGMYKNILNSNRRGTYTSQRKYVSTRGAKKTIQQFEMKSPIKVDAKKKASISARRICDDLDDPFDSKNQYFKQLQLMKQVTTKEYDTLVRLVESTVKPSKKSPDISKDKL